MNMNRHRLGTGLTILGLFLLAGLAAPAAQAQQKIGVFNSQVVFTKALLGKQIQERLSKMRDDKQLAIDLKEKEYNQLKDRYMTQRLSLSEERRKELMKEIETKRIELDRLRKDSERALMQEMEEVQNDLQDKMVQVVERIGQEQGFDLILERIQYVFASAAHDITDKVIERLDATYAKPAQ